MIIFTSKNDPSNTPIRDNLDGINYTSEFYQLTSLNIIEQKESLIGFSIPMATNIINKDSRNIIDGILFNSNSFNIEIPNLYQTDLSVDDKNTTAIFFYTEELPSSGMTITPTSVKNNAGIVFNGSLSYNDMLANGDEGAFDAPTITNSDEINITYNPDLSGVKFFTNIITDVKSNMETILQQSVLENFDLSIINKKPIQLGGISNIENDFLVLNEDLTEIIYKGPLSIGNFTKQIISQDSKVHVISVPKDELQNFIPFRNIQIT